MFEEGKLSFEELIHPVTSQEFYADFWERRHLFIRRRNASFYGSIFSAADIDRSIGSACGTLQENLSIIPPPDSERKIEQHRPADLPMDKVYGAFSRGDTIRLMALQRTWPPLSRLAATVGDAFSADVNVNFYMTPARSQGFPVHVDTHEALILQVEGSKDWFIYEPDYPLPINTLTHMEDLKARLKSPLVEAELRLVEQLHLEKGDLLYIPRGVPHKAVASETPSLHLTVGIHLLYWVDFIKRAVELVCVEEPDLRKALPLGFSRDPSTREEMPQAFRTCLELVFEKAPFQRTLDALIRARVASRPYPSDGHLEQLTRLEEIQIDSLLERRDGLECLVESSEGRATVTFASNQVKGPAAIAPALEHVRDHRRFRVADLPSLDDKSRLVLARRLVREGLLRMVGESDRLGASEGVLVAGAAN